MPKEVIQTRRVGLPLEHGDFVIDQREFQPKGSRYELLVKLTIYGSLYLFMFRKWDKMLIVQELLRQGVEQVSLTQPYTEWETYSKWFEEQINFVK